MGREEKLSPTAYKIGEGNSLGACGGSFICIRGTPVARTNGVGGHTAPGLDHAILIFYSPDKIGSRNARRYESRRIAATCDRSSRREALDQQDTIVRGGRVDPKRLLNA
jgi:hypothetical protein